MSDDYDWTQDHDWVGDPEIREDLRKRSASERDPSRTRRAVGAMGSATAIVAQWQCLAQGCDRTVGVTEDAVFALATCNAELERRGEPPIAPAAFCAEHQELRTALRADRQVERREEMARLIRQLKDSSSPGAETALLAKLRRSGHPDVDGLLASLLGAKPKRKGRL